MTDLNAKSDALYNYCLVFLPLLVTGHIYYTKAQLWSVDQAGLMPRGLKDHLAFLLCSRQRLSYIPSISVIFMSAMEYFQALSFKHYLLAVKKIEPLQSTGVSEKGFKNSSGRSTAAAIGKLSLLLALCVGFHFNLAAGDWWLFLLCPEQIYKRKKR